MASAQINLISLATVKTELGLTNTTYDTQISALIPKVSADIRRILNTNYDNYFDCSFSADADSIGAIYARPVLRLGTVLYHPNLPDDTYVTAYNPDTGNYSISATPDDEGSYVFPTINISQWATISKMIWYRISLLSTDYGERTAQSESYGKISKTYAGNINSRWNYPQQLIDDLGAPFAKVG